MSTAVDLEQFDDTFTTATPSYGGSGLKLADIPDGDYEFAVKSCEIKDTAKGPLVSIKLEILTTGPHEGGMVDHVYFLTKDEQGVRVKNDNQIAQLRKDLVTLGFDADNWKKENSRPLSVELARAAIAMPGICFHAKKTQNPSGGKIYHNLKINSRSADDGLPAKFGPKELEAAGKDPFGA